MQTPWPTTNLTSPHPPTSFVSLAGSRLVVVDLRNPDPTVGPGDAKTLVVAGFPDKVKHYRPMVIHLLWNRETNQMELPKDMDKDTPIITHCSAGRRGQMAKEFLEQNGFTNVLNGGGPKEKECWAEFGGKWECWGVFSSVAAILVHLSYELEVH